ncbi:flagellar basal body P-ring formation chaperone FlgA [Thiomicrospira microaerophila]|uniref:flagellar basal body P-ring formation chaperone FlgA n=1 Tax=Thiomicrospira microaerophila TaxID=406020 RepID=UPI0006963D36|nr:flagellar basal body P-ring formation chaperone FlgA [Thiomicrospira microaerophila]
MAISVLLNNTRTKIANGIYIILCGWLFLFSNTLYALENQSLDAIHQAVFDHLKQSLDQRIIEPKINIRHLSQNLTLPACTTPLSLSNRSQNLLFGRQTVLVECTEPNWRVFVSAEIDGNVMAVVAKRGIVRQAFIQPEDIELRPVGLSEVRRGWLEELDNVQAMRAKRAIRPNTVITLPMLDIPYWVIEKQEVNLITRVSGLEIRTTGVALNNGMAQEQVEVRNTQSNIIVKGIVIAPNTVLVP